MFGAFLDIVGASDSTPQIIIEAARWQSFNDIICPWELLKKKHSL